MPAEFLAVAMLSIVVLFFSNTASQTFPRSADFVSAKA
jgi:hypothetical protein